MFQNSLRKKIGEEINFNQNYLSRFLWQILIWSFWSFWLILTILLLLSKKGFYFGLLSLILLISQFKFLKNRKNVPLKIKELEDGWDFLLPKTKKIIIESYKFSKSTSQSISSSLLKVLVQDKDVRKIFKNLDLSEKNFKEEIEKISDKKEEEKEEKIDFLEKVTKEAIFEADLLNSKAVEPYHLLLSLLKTKDKNLSNFLLHLGLSEKDLKGSVQILDFEKKFIRKGFHFLPFKIESKFAKKRKIKHRIMNRSWTARSTPFLDKFSSDLTDLARYDLIGFMIGHKEELDRLLDILGRELKNNALLVGREGSGKETMVCHLSWLIANDQVPKKLFDKRIVKLNLADLSAGAETEGELRKRGEIVLNEILRAKNIILYLPNLEQLVSKSQIGLLSEIFLPYFKESYFQVIGSTTEKGLDELRKNQELLSTFEEIRVKEISESETLKILVLHSLFLKEKEKIETSLPALRKIIELAKIYNPRKIFPSVGIELLDEAIKEARDRKLNLLTADLVTEIVERKTKIPLKKVGKLEAKELLNLEEEIHQTFINQEPAVKATADALRAYRTGLRSEKGPIASFLFVGPTGVGKTQLSKTLARILFGSEKEIIRFDLSKYQEAESIWKFIGSPTGEVGELSDSILKKPYSVLLLDEFEKANIKILNLFLPILDEGKIKDNLGQDLDFSNSLIIATSNARSEYIFEKLKEGESFEKITEELKNLLVKDFPPELLNRFTDIIIFKPLSKEDIKKIALLKLKPIKEELSQKYKYSLDFSEKAFEKIIEMGYSKEFGARPLEHILQREIKSLLAKEVLEHQWPIGTNLKVDWNGEKFFIKIDKDLKNK